MPIVLGRVAATGQLKLSLSDGSTALARWNGNSEPAIGSSVQYDAGSRTANSKVAISGGNVPRPLSRWEQPYFTLEKDRNDVNYVNGEIWDIDKPLKKAAGKVAVLFSTFDSLGSSPVYIGGATAEPLLIDTLSAGAYIATAKSSVHLLPDSNFIAGVAALDYNTSMLELYKYTGNLLEATVTKEVLAVYDLSYLPSLLYFGLASWQVLSKGWPQVYHFALTNPPAIPGPGTVGLDACDLGTSGTSATPALVYSAQSGFVLSSVSGSGTRTNTSELKTVAGSACVISSASGDIGKVCNSGTGSSSYTLAGAFIANSTADEPPLAASGSYTLQHTVQDSDYATLQPGGAGPTCSTAGFESQNFLKAEANASFAWTTAISSFYQLASTETYVRPMSSDLFDIAVLTYADVVLSAASGTTSCLVYLDSGSKTYNAGFFAAGAVPGSLSFSTPPVSSKAIKLVLADLQETVLAVSSAKAAELTAKDANLLGSSHRLVTAYDLETGSATVSATDLASNPASGEELEVEFEPVLASSFAGGVYAISVSSLGDE